MYVLQTSAHLAHSCVLLVGMYGLHICSQTASHIQWTYLITEAGQIQHLAKKLLILRYFHLSLLLGNLYALGSYNDSGPS